MNRKWFAAIVLIVACGDRASFDAVSAPTVQVVRPPANDGVVPHVDGGKFTLGISVDIDGFDGSTRARVDIVSPFVEPEKRSKVVALFERDEGVLYGEVELVVPAGGRIEYSVTVANRTSTHEVVLVEPRVALDCAPSALKAGAWTRTCCVGSSLEGGTAMLRIFQAAAAPTQSKLLTLTPRPCASGGDGLSGWGLVNIDEPEGDYVVQASLVGFDTEAARTTIEGSRTRIPLAVTSTSTPGKLPAAGEPIEVEVVVTLANQQGGAAPERVVKLETLPMTAAVPAEATTDDQGRAIFVLIAGEGAALRIDAVVEGQRVGITLRR